MYGIFTIIYPINGPNVGKYTIHGAYGIVYNYLVTSALPFFKPLNSRIALEYSSRMAQVYLDTDYSFWFFKPEDVSKWHALKPQRLE